jgi:DNA-binding NarL/FixJ family response regulator
VIVDDQALVRTGFAKILADVEGITVVGEAGDGQQALEIVARTNPDILLLDVRMPDMDGIDTTRAIRARSGQAERPRIIILTTFDLDEYAYAALRAGADGFLLKDTLATDLINAIRIVAAGEAIIAPTTTRRLIQQFVNQPQRQAPDLTRLDVLTPRERDVFDLIAQGWSNTEIAGALFLSEGTVKTHVSRVLTKLALRDRIQAVILARELDLPPPPKRAP